MFIRKYAPADHAALIHLISQCGTEMTSRLLDAELDEPGARVRENTFLAVENGTVIGDIRLSFMSTADAKRFCVFCYGEVHPDWQSRGVGTALYQFIAEHFQNLTHREGTSITLIQHLGVEKAAQRRVLEKVGFHSSIHLYRMRLQLPMSLVDTAIPEGFSMRLAMPSDAARLSEIYNQAFAWRTDVPVLVSPESVEFEFVEPNYESTVYLVLLAASGETVGFVHGTLNRRTTPSEGHIETIAVLPGHQGNGFGRLLLSESIRAMQAIGVGEVRLNYESDNSPAATHLYQSTGFEQVGESIRYILA